MAIEETQMEEDHDQQEYKEELELKEEKMEKSSKSPPKIELKPLPPSLKYACLVDEGEYPFIVNATLDGLDLVKLLVVLRKYRNVIGFDEACLEAFQKLKGALISSPAVQAPDWSLPFELMCDANDFAVGAVLGQKKEGKSHVIYYASRTLDEAQKNYTTTMKEMLAVVFAIDKFRSYLICSKVIVYTDHIAVRYLMTKGELISLGFRLRTRRI
ncbi:uncharacterized protein LOC110695830 [Chenopodium quinoa]|uniref:uncharacterized protein LOC110695830 n=1 Tax=Chenopodium quinoa TaxID=63459 RepID=UPI000B7805FF|nr:uncharacterized protein LOC110695830 [Chenopodium quinoa]